MATRSFTRNIIVSDQKAVEKLQNIVCSDAHESSVAPMLMKNSNLIHKKADPRTIENILHNF